MVVSIYTDGGSRGNPGPAAYGWVVYDQNKTIIQKQSKFLGVKTNNQAEYLGLLAALTWLKNNQHRFTSAHLYSDSQLLVKQIENHYKVKSKNIKPLFSTAQKLIDQISLPIKFFHLLRHQNKLADQLANQAMDQAS